MNPTLVALSGEPSHDPNHHEFMGHMGDWDMYGFLPTHPCHSCFAGRGKLYLLLCHRERAVSLVTPCVQNGARFEVRAEEGSLRQVDGINRLYAWLQHVLYLSPPPRKALIAAARWFLDAPERRARMEHFAATAAAGATTDAPSA